MIAFDYNDYDLRARYFIRSSLFTTSLNFQENLSRDPCYLAHFIGTEIEALIKQAANDSAKAKI